MSVHVSDRLSAYLDGELSVVDAADVRQHLATCDACSAELAELAAVDRAVRGLPVTAPASYFDTFATRVRSRIESSGRTRTRRILPRWSWAVAAAVLLAVVLPRMPWDAAPSPASRPAAQAPAPSLPPAAPAGSVERDALLRQEAGRSDEKRSRVGMDQPKADAESPGKARRQYAEPPPEAQSSTPAAPALASAPAPTPAPATADAARAPRASSADAPRTAAPSTGAAGAKAKDAETEKLNAEYGLLDEAAAGEAASTQDLRAKEQLEKKGERPARPRAAREGEAGALAAEVAGTPPAQGTLRSLETGVAVSLEEQRALREDWRKLAHEHPEDPRADEARVRVVTLGVEIARVTGKAEDLAQVRADAAAYLARADARQKERVRALLAELGR